MSQPYMAPLNNIADIDEEATIEIAGLNMPWWSNRVKERSSTFMDFPQQNEIIQQTMNNLNGYFGSLSQSIYEISGSAQNLSQNPVIGGYVDLFEDSKQLVSSMEQRRNELSAILAQQNQANPIVPSSDPTPEQIQKFTSPALDNSKAPERPPDIVGPRGQAAMPMVGCPSEVFEMTDISMVNSVVLEASTIRPNIDGIQYTGVEGVFLVFRASLSAVDFTGTLKASVGNEGTPVSPGDREVDVKINSQSPEYATANEIKFSLLSADGSIMAETIVSFE